jgi:hypothetical protein
MKPELDKLLRECRRYRDWTASKPSADSLSN